MVGLRKLFQFEDNLQSLSLTLTPEHVRALDEASAIEPGFPYSMYSRGLVRGFRLRWNARPHFAAREDPLSHDSQRKRNVATKVEGNSGFER